MTREKGADMKRTDLITFDNGKAYRVYEDRDGRLYYRMQGVLHGTWKEYCIKGKPSRVK